MKYKYVPFALVLLMAGCSLVSNNTGSKDYEKFLNGKDNSEATEAVDKNTALASASLKIDTGGGNLTVTPDVMNTMTKSNSSKAMIDALTADKLELAALLRTTRSELTKKETSIEITEKMVEKYKNQSGLYMILNAIGWGMMAIVFIGFVTWITAKTKPFINGMKRSFGLTMSVLETSVKSVSKKLHNVDDRLADNHITPEERRRLEAEKSFLGTLHQGMTNGTSNLSHLNEFKEKFKINR